MAAPDVMRAAPHVRRQFAVAGGVSVALTVLVLALGAIGAAWLAVDGWPGGWPGGAHDEHAVSLPAAPAIGHARPQGPGLSTPSAAAIHAPVPTLAAHPRSPLQPHRDRSGGHPRRPAQRTPVAVRRSAPAKPVAAAPAPTQRAANATTVTPPPAQPATRTQSAPRLTPVERQPAGRGQHVPRRVHGHHADEGTHVLSVDGLTPMKERHARRGPHVVVHTPPHPHPATPRRPAHGLTTQAHRPVPPRSPHAPNAQPRRVIAGHAPHGPAHPAPPAPAHPSPGPAHPSPTAGSHDPAAPHGRGPHS